jgi:hypothetical protein
MKLPIHPQEVTMTTKNLTKLVVLTGLLILTALSVFLLSCDRRSALQSTNEGNQPSDVANILILLSPNQVYSRSPQSVDTVTIAVAVADEDGVGLVGVDVSLTRSPNFGLLTPPDTTDAQGIAYASFITQPGIYNSVDIVASAGDKSDTATLIITGPSRYSLSLTFSPPVPKLIDHDADPCIVSAVLVDSTQRGVSGQQVTFAVLNDVGLIGFADPDIDIPLTNSQGLAQALFYNTELDEIELPDSAIIQAVTPSAEGGQLARSVIIPLRQVRNSLSLAANPGTIIGDGTSTVSIRAFLVDTDLHGIVDDTVRFRNIGNDGYIQALAITDDNGIANAVFTPFGSVDSPDTTQVVAEYRAGSIVHRATSQVNVIVMPVRSIGFITVSLQAQTLTANGAETSSVFITVQDSTGDLISDGTVVYIDRVGLGTLSAPQTSTVDGQARVTITAPSSIAEGPTDALIIVSGNVNDSVMIADTAVVHYEPGNVAELQFIRPEGPVTLVAGSGDVDTIEVYAVDAYGNPAANGTQIRFRNSPLDSSSTLSPEAALTDNGVARTIYLVGARTGDDNVIAFIPDPENDNDTIRTVNPVVYHCISSEATTMDLRASRSNIEVGGQSTQIFATLEDAYGNPLSEGYVVAFDITVAPGAGGPDDWKPSFRPDGLLWHDTAETNPNGQAIVQLYSGQKSGAVSIRACTVADTLFVCTEKALVTISSGPPDYINITFRFQGEAFPNSPDRFVQVAAEVGDRYQNPVQWGTAVYFTLTPPGVAIIEGDSYTGGPRSYHADSTNGVAYTRIIYGCLQTYDTLRVIASSAGDSAEVIDTSGVFSLPIFDGVLSVSASPGNLWVDSCACTCSGSPRGCRDTSLVTAYLADGGGCPIRNGEIGFTALVAGFIIEPSIVLTDENGRAQVRYYIRGCDIPLNPDGTQATITTSVMASLIRTDVVSQIDIVCSRRPVPPCANEPE